MSLRTTYSGSLNTALASARAAGRAMIIPDPVGAPTVPTAALSTAMTNAAAAGKVAFEYTAGITFQPSDIALQGPLWDALKSGVAEGLASQDIMATEYTISFVSGTTPTLKITFSF